MYFLFPILSRFVLAVCFVLLCVVANADTDKDKRDGANRSLDRSVRIAAYTRLIDNPALSSVEHAQAFLQRGILVRLNREWGKAMTDFDRCLELDPGNALARRNRGYVFFNTRRYSEAEAEFTKALEQEPRNEGHFFYRGRARAELDRLDDAIADYTQALVFRPRYFDAYTGRARAYRQKKDYENAVADCDAALSLNPYEAAAYYVRGLARESMKDTDGAIHDYAIAQALNPNIAGTEDGLQRMQTVAGPIDAEAPIAFADPKNGLTITYLKTNQKQIKPSEADEFVGELLGWFKKKRLPEPTSKLFLIRQVESSIDGKTAVKASHQYEETDGKLNASSFHYFRSMWPMVLHGPAGTTIDIEMERDPIQQLWPLTVGNQGKGSGKLEFVGPDPLTPQAMFMGAKQPGDRVPMGTSTWNGSVLGWETVVVPAGIYKTVKLKIDETVELNFFGRTNKVESTVTVWYAPSIHWWVKRQRETRDIVTNDLAVSIK